jgi:hypothetical protein
LDLLQRHELPQYRLAIRQYVLSPQTSVTTAENRTNAGMIRLPAFVSF